jgi:polar amino acid transport system substrate-binding protein
MTNLAFARLNRRAALRRLPVFAFAAIAMAGFTLGVTTIPSQAASLKEITARGYATAVTEDDFKPFEFMEDGVSKGYDNDLLAEVKKKLPFDIKQQILPWSGILPGVTTGKYDIAVTAVLVTAARKPAFEFTTPVAQSTTFFATKAGSAIKKGSDLNGKTVGAQAGSAMLAELKTFDASLKAKGGAGLKKIVEYPSNPEAYQDLALGRTDAVVNTEINLRSLAKEKPGVFAVGEGIAKPVYIAWAIQKGNTEFAKAIDDAILAVRKSGKMYELQEKWFGVAFKDMAESAK